MKYFQGVVRRGSVWSGRGFLLPDIAGEEQSPRQGVMLWSRGWSRCRGDWEPVGTVDGWHPVSPIPKKGQSRARHPVREKEQHQDSAGTAPQETAYKSIAWKKGP